MGSDGFGSLEHRGVCMLHCDGPVDRGVVPSGQIINHQAFRAFLLPEDFFQILKRSIWTGSKSEC